MLIRSMVLGTLAGIALSWSGLARADDDPSCEAKCDRQAGLSSTDRATCKANCRQDDSSQSWRKKVLGKGSGAANPAAKPQARTPAPAATAAPARQPGTTARPVGHAVDTRAFMAACQTSCDRELQPTNRATCKLQCLQGARRPVSATPGTAGPSTSARPAAPANARPSSPPPRATTPSPASCVAACDRQSSLSSTDRATCKANCRQDAASHSWRDTVVDRPATGSGSTAPRSSAPSDASCRNTCGQRYGSCVNGCGSHGDGATCRLQCEQTQRGCSARCAKASR